MSFIELDGLGNIQELQLAEEGQYELIVNDVNQYTKESTQNDVIQLTIAFDGRPELSTFRHWLSLPGAQDDAQKIENKMRMLKRALTLMRVAFDANGFDVDDLNGAMFSAGVTKEVMTNQDGEEILDDDGQPRFVNRLRVPRFKD